MRLATICEERFKRIQEKASLLLSYQYYHKASVIDGGSEVTSEGKKRCIKLALEYGV